MLIIILIKASRLCIFKLALFRLSCVTICTASIYYNGSVMHVNNLTCNPSLRNKFNKTLWKFMLTNWAPTTQDKLYLCIYFGVKLLNHVFTTTIYYRVVSKVTFPISTICMSRLKANAHSLFLQPISWLKPYNFISFVWGIWPRLNSL